jgi:3-dehydroquinate synthase
LLEGNLLPTLLHGAEFSRRCALITNPRVGHLHGARVLATLRQGGFEPYVIEIPEGEKFKTLETVSTIYDRLIEARLDRRSVIFALGGGVVGDIAGFAAATFLRGVPFMQLPTTLLAIVDASIGGKVAVDHPLGKNLIGAFKQPCAVLADTHTLSTLPQVEWRAGMAEVVKNAIIGDPGLFEELREASELNVEKWLGRAVQVKTEIVTRDPHEQADRAKLNLGHTFGHALEQVSNYGMRHGDAVAIGLVCAAWLAHRFGIAEPDLRFRIQDLLIAIGLPTRIPIEMSTDALLAAMLADKKWFDGRLRFILPRGMGDVITVDAVARWQIAQVIEDLR